jgi:hypothetical protein
MVMSTWVGVKVMAELVTALGGLIFLSGLALRGRARDIAISFGAALVGLSGVVILLECLFGLLDPNRYPSAILMVLFGAGLITGMVRKQRNPAQPK